jgi:hypothetical protein
LDCGAPAHFGAPPFIFLKEEIGMKMKRKVGHRPSRLGELVTQAAVRPWKTLLVGLIGIFTLAAVVISLRGGNPVGHVFVVVFLIGIGLGTGQFLPEGRGTMKMSNLFVVNPCTGNLDDCLHEGQTALGPSQQGPMSWTRSGR